MLEYEKEEVIEDNVLEIEEDEESPGISDPVEALGSFGPTSSETSDSVVVEEQSVKKKNTERKRKVKKTSKRRAYRECEGSDGNKSIGKSEGE